MLDTFLFQKFLYHQGFLCLATFSSFYPKINPLRSFMLTILKQIWYFRRFSATFCQLQDERQVWKCRPFCKVGHFWAMELVKTRRLKSRNCPFRGKGDIIQLENASNKRIVDTMDKWSSWRRPWLLAGWHQMVVVSRPYYQIFEGVRSSANSKTSAFG